MIDDPGFYEKPEFTACPKCGTAPVNRECDTCGGEGWRTRGGIMRECEECHGEGFFRYCQNCGADLRPPRARDGEEDDDA